VPVVKSATSGEVSLVSQPWLPTRPPSVDHLHKKSFSLVTVSQSVSQLIKPSSIPRLLIAHSPVVDWAFCNVGISWSTRMLWWNAENAIPEVLSQKNERWNCVPEPFFPGIGIINTLCLRPNFVSLCVPDFFVVEKNSTDH
jgi:hypothetical protein